MYIKEKRLAGNHLFMINQQHRNTKEYHAIISPPCGKATVPMQAHKSGHPDSSGFSVKE